MENEKTEPNLVSRLVAWAAHCGGDLLRVLKNELRANRNGYCNWYDAL